MRAVERFALRRVLRPFLHSVLLASAACSSGSTRFAGVGRPTMPPQFTSVPEAEWTIDKPLVGGPHDCRGGKVRVFDCRNVDLLAFLPNSAIGGGQVSDIWGWTDRTTGREFALVARDAGTSFVEITDPANPRYLGQLPFHEGAIPSLWRELKVYQHHVFIVSDVPRPHGMQVFDLRQLLAVTGAPATFAETAHYDGFGNMHTIIIDTASGFAYMNQRGKCGGEPQGADIIDIRDPVRPVFAGCSTMTGHDAQCVRYRGPDQQYRDREICLYASMMTGLGIVDVTEKRRARTISSASYPSMGYPHQGWLSEDHRYFFLGDEIDEMSNNPTRTIVFDLNDLDDPVVVKEYFATTYANDHNMYVRGRYLYQTNYKAGLRVLDVGDPRDPKEVAYFDTTPGAEGRGLAGTWSNYPYFESGVIAVASIDEGVFILRHRVD